MARHHQRRVTNIVASLSRMVDEATLGSKKGTDNDHTSAFTVAEDIAMNAQNVVRLLDWASY